MNHDNLAVRDLAFWHLALLVPEGARTIPYGPLGNLAQRGPWLEKWRKLLPAGTVPNQAK